MSSIKGKVKWFNGSKGYGFIERDDKQKDVFVHMSAVKDAGIDYLDEGDVLTFDIEDGLLLSLLSFLTFEFIKHLFRH